MSQVNVNDSCASLIFVPTAKLCDPIVSVRLPVVELNVAAVGVNPLIGDLPTLTVNVPPSISDSTTSNHSREAGSDALGYT